MVYLWVSSGDNMALFVASMFIVSAGFCASVVHTNGESCSEQGLLQCETHQQCYSVRQKCNGFWDCVDKSDEWNCTTEHNVSFSGISKTQNLAWLITPILLLLGAAYGVYKCARDGVCTAIRHRIMDGYRHRENDASDYHPLHQVSFYTSTRISCTHLGAGHINLTPEQQMMLIHNQSFSIQFQNINPVPGQHLGAMTSPGLIAPPSYEEALSTMSNGRGGTLVVMKDGSVITLPPAGIQPPPYPTTTPRCSTKRYATPAGHMEAIEEVDEVEEEEDDNADEGAFFLPKESCVDGSRGRRRHHSQWSQKKRTSERRRHHSCPS